LFLLSLLWCVPAAWAQSAPQPAEAAVMSGGIGEESMRDLVLRKHAYNLKFVFTLLEGDYVADVAVNIADEAGRKVLEHVANGPVLLARLPAGRYVATFTYGGMAQTHPFTLRERGLRSIQARWKRTEADGPPLL
jgi:hypothetical protein